MSKKNIYLAIVTGILCVLLLAIKLTGPRVHVIGGGLLTVICVKHLWRRMRVLNHMRREVQIVDWVLLVALIAMFLSGILLHPMGDILWIKVVHKLSSVLFIVFVIVHSVQHIKKIAKKKPL